MQAPNFRMPNPGFDVGYPVGYNPGGMQMPPPLPPRPTTATTYSSYYSSPYSSYGIGNYGSYGGYGGYNSWGGGYGYRPSFHDPNYDSRLVQMAEQGVRPAFNTIQSIINAMSSITTMFDSTFHAVHSSYMSVIGLADSFSRLKAMFGQILSAFALIRTLNWLYRKLLYSLGLRKDNPMIEGAWSAASENHSVPRQKGNWANLAVVGAVLSAPYFLFKIVSQLYPPQETWDPAKHKGQPMTTAFSFATVNQGELPFQPNECLVLAPKEFQPASNSGWVLACNQRGQKGLVPMNYLKPANPQAKPVPKPNPPNYLANIVGEFSKEGSKPEETTNEQAVAAE